MSVSCFQGRKKTVHYLKKKKKGITTRNQLKYTHTSNEDKFALSKIYQKCNYSAKGENCRFWRGNGCPALPFALSCVRGRLAVRAVERSHSSGAAQPGMQPGMVAAAETRPPAYFWGSNFALSSWTLPWKVQTISSACLMSSLKWHLRSNTAPWLQLGPHWQW